MKTIKKNDNYFLEKIPGVFMGLCFLLILLPEVINAQSPQWQWANRGGSSTQQGNDEEYADDVEVDAAGNTYVTGRVYEHANFGHNGNSLIVPSYGMMDIFLAKYDCAGNQVWLDILGSPGNDYPNGLEIGKDGMLYLFGRDNSTPLTILTDSNTSSFPLTVTGAFLCKFNAEGTLQKFRTFAPLFMRTNANQNLLTLSDDMTLHILAWVTPGKIDSIFPVARGTIVASLDTSLNTLSVVQVSVDSLTPTSILHTPYFTKLPKSNMGSIYLVGNMNITGDSAELGGVIFQMADSAYANGVAAKFDSVGNLLWYEQGTTTPFDAFSNPTCNRFDNLIILLQASNGDTVLGYPFQSGASDNNFAVVKLNANNGGVMYGMTSTNSSPLFIDLYHSDLEVGSNNNLYFTAQLRGNLIFDTISVYCDISNVQPLLWKFQDLDTAFKATSDYALVQGNSHSTYGNIPYALTVDEQGNVFIAGTVSGDIYTTTDTVVALSGSSVVDMFVAKYGLACNDTTALIEPYAPDLLTATANSAQSILVSWTDNSHYEQGFYLYRSLDSVHYSLYDSVAANVTNYLDAGVVANTVYWYKAAAYNNIGSSNFTNADSAEIIPTGIEESIANKLQFVVQPNPNTGDFMLIAALAQSGEAVLKITGIDGREVFRQNLQIHRGNNQFFIHLGDQPAGLYIATIETRQGTARRKVVVK